LSRLNRVTEQIAGRPCSQSCRFEVGDPVPLVFKPLTVHV